MNDPRLRRTRLGAAAAAVMTAISIVGAASAATPAPRLAFCLAAAAAAGLCGGLVDRGAILRGGHRALLRTAGLLGALAYLVLLPALGYGERTVALLTQGDLVWRTAFVATVVVVLVIAFTLAQHVWGEARRASNAATTEAGGA